MVSTLTEKTTICHYFLKPAKKKTLQTCNTAGFLSPRFSRWAIGGGPGQKRPLLRRVSRKKDPHIRVISAFSGAGWVNAQARINLDFRAFGGHSLTSKAGDFRQTGRNWGLFSMRTQTDGFTGFSGRGMDQKREIRAQYGRIFSPFPIPPDTGISCQETGRNESFRAG
jgi:hypothetical protein